MAERILLMAPDRAAILGMLDLIPGLAIGAPVRLPIPEGTGLDPEATPIEAYSISPASSGGAGAGVRAAISAVREAGIGRPRGGSRETVWHLVE